MIGVSISHGSLYSRQTLVVGLLGTCQTADDPVVRDFRTHLQTIKLTPFDAPRTLYERLAFMDEAIIADTLTVRMRYLNDASDDDLEKIIAAVSPPGVEPAPARPSVE